MILKIAVNNRPVAPGGDRNPRAMTARCTVAGLSVEAHDDPPIRTPPTHSARVIVPLGITLPVRSAP